MQQSDHTFFLVIFIILGITSSTLQYKNNAVLDDYLVWMVTFCQEAFRFSLFFQHSAYLHLPIEVSF